MLPLPSGGKEAYEGLLSLGSKVLLARITKTVTLLCTSSLQRTKSITSDEVIATL